MKKFNEILKGARKSQKILVRQLAEQLNVDASLISRFEKGTRLPTKAQLIKIAEILDIPFNDLLTQWLGEKVISYLDNEDFAYHLQALQVAEDIIKYENSQSNITSSNYELSTILDNLNDLKNKLSKYRKLDSHKIVEALELEYTYESNKIEGNTLTLQETDIVINEGITISGKSMREHLEAINHNDAIAFIKELVTNKNAITESNVLRIHNLVLRGIDQQNAGKYRTVQVMIKGSKWMPPQPYLVAKQMEDLFIWYRKNKNNLHPVLLAAEMHERLVTIHPFIDGNGRTSRLLMNLILLQHGFIICNVKGNYESRINYYNCLQEAQTTNNKTRFLELICEVEKECLLQYISILYP